MRRSVSECVCLGFVTHTHRLIDTSEGDAGKASSAEVELECVWIPKSLSVCMQENRFVLVSLRQCVKLNARV